MKKFFYIIALLSLTLISCDKGESDNYNWRKENEAQFTLISNDPAYKKIESQSGKGFIMHKEIKSGEGKTPLFTDKVRVLYTGWYKLNWSKPDTYKDDMGNLIKNKVIFDSTTSRSDIPATFSISPSSGSGGLIEGFSTALQYMQEGDIWEIWIPWSLGYGEKSSGNIINGYTTLVFEVELVEVL